MSALESPPTLTSTWQDPWSAVTSATINPMTASTASDDFYNTKTQMPAFVGMYPSHHHHHHHHQLVQPHQYNNPMMGGGHHEAGHQHNNNNSMNSDANSSSSAASTASTKKTARQVNFKLDIKSEPLEPNNIVGSQDMCQNNNPGMNQKVRSISDLSDPESSLDIPCNQVPPLTPSTNKKVGDALKSTYNTWNKETERSAVPKDPRSWTKEHVRHWLTWAIREFSLDGPNFSQFVQQFQIPGKEICSLPKEEFLAKAPAFMGDILWAHLEILQKDVDRGANIENVPSNYTDPSFAIPDTFQRTYTQLDVAAPSSQQQQLMTAAVVSSVEAGASLLISNNRPQFTQRTTNGGCYPTSVADYVSNNGSTVDSSSEFSYQMTEMKYSPQQNQQQQQIQNNGRVPAYPPLVYNDQFGTENMWPYQPNNPAAQAQPAPPPLPQHAEAWHQPHDYPQQATPSATTLASQ